MHIFFLLCTCIYKTQPDGVISRSTLSLEFIKLLFISEKKLHISDYILYGKQKKEVSCCIMKNRMIVLGYKTEFSAFINKKKIEEKKLFLLAKSTSKTILQRFVFCSHAIAYAFLLVLRWRQVKNSRRKFERHLQCRFKGKQQKVTKALGIEDPVQTWRWKYQRETERYGNKNCRQKQERSL